MVGRSSLVVALLVGAAGCASKQRPARAEGNTPEESEASEPAIPPDLLEGLKDPVPENRTKAAADLARLDPPATAPLLGGA